MVRNTSENYGSVSKFFHWLLFFLVLGMIIYGYVMDYFPKDWKPVGYNIHKLMGLTILGLMLLRLIWTLLNPKPRMPIKMPAWQRYSALAVHYLFYILLIAMPLSGWVFSSFAGKPPHIFGISLGLPLTKSKPLAEFFEEIHVTLAVVIIVLLVLHILAALKHHYYDKDNVLIRMLPFRPKAQPLISKSEPQPK